jgi:hypothetical protein
LVENVTSFLAIAFQGDIAISVLELVRMTVAMPDVNPDDEAVLRFRGVEKGPRCELRHSILHIVLVRVREVKESFIASSSEVEHVLLTVDFHLPGVFKFFVEGSTKRVNGSGCRDNEMASMVWTRKHLVPWWGSAHLRWWRHEKIGVFAVCPVIELVKIR